MRRSTIPYSVIGLLILAPIEAPANQYSEIVAFGASLTDGGNVYEASAAVLGFHFPVSPPNYMGRFSNGPSWVDRLADLVGVDRPVASLNGGTNHAWSGATTGAVVNLFGVVDMDDQVAGYLQDATFSGEELVVVAGWAALNDFSNLHPRPATASDAAQYMGRSIRDLAAAGAKHIFLPLGMTVRPNAPLRSKVESYNQLLLDEVIATRRDHPETLITTYDVQRTLDSFLADPGAIGIRFVNGQACNDCMFTNPNPVQIADNPNEYLFWEGNHLTDPANAALGQAAFERLTSPYLIDEDFGSLPSSGLPFATTYFDSNVGQPWGPGVVTHENGTLRFQTTGEIPPHSPPERQLETGLMALTWDESEAFTDGYLRATLRAETESDANLVLRGNLGDLSGYLFTGVGKRGQFEMHCFCGDESGLLGTITSPAFEIGVDYHMEASAVSDKLTMKVWRVGEEEPDLPQLTVFNDRLTDGVVALAPASSPAGAARSVRVDVTYNDLTYRPVNAIPEPSSAALLLFGLLACGRIRSTICLDALADKIP